MYVSELGFTQKYMLGRGKVHPSKLRWQ